MSMISSTTNPTIKAIRALRQRTAREERGVFFVEGIRLVGEAADLNIPLEMVVTAPDLLNSEFARQVVTRLIKRGVMHLEVTASVFESISGKDNPQGIGVVARQQWIPFESIRAACGLGWVALVEAQDPGNIGTILRTADAVGMDGVILLGPCADPYDPGAVRASMGALFSLQLVRGSFEQFQQWQKRIGFPVIGTSDSAELDYQQKRYPSPLVVLMGSERQGLTPAQQAICETMVSIPMRGRSDSLNLAVATGVMLYEVLNQQRRNHP